MEPAPAQTTCPRAASQCSSTRLPTSCPSSTTAACPFVRTTRQRRPVEDCERHPPTACGQSARSRRTSESFTQALGAEPETYVASSLPIGGCMAITPVVPTAAITHVCAAELADRMANAVAALSATAQTPPAAEWRMGGSPVAALSSVLIPVRRRGGAHRCVMRTFGTGAASRRASLHRPVGTLLRSTGWLKRCRSCSRSP